MKKTIGTENAVEQVLRDMGVLLCTEYKFAARDLKYLDLRMPGVSWVEFCAAQTKVDNFIAAYYEQMKKLGGSVRE